MERAVLLLSYTDDHLKELLRTALTSIQPDLKKLTKKVDKKNIPLKQI